MTASPIICFGQQPCGVFPRRYLVAKIQTARQVQSELGGDIVFFYHDSDHDPRETRTILRHRKSFEPFAINFTFDSPTQRKFSPLYLKRVRTDWIDKTALQLPAYVDRPGVEAFKQVRASNVADFCLDMYRSMGLLDGIQVARSSDPAFREAACEVSDFFVDVPHEGEIVRARYIDGQLKLHKGGDVYVTLPHSLLEDTGLLRASPDKARAGQEVLPFTRRQISPSRDTRLRWMQSVVRCTHYIAGLGEQAYLHREDAPHVTFLNRMAIDRSDEAYTD